MIRRGAHALAHLLTSLVLGPATFVWALLTTLVSGVLSFTYLAPPAFLLVTWMTRRIAGLERLRAALVLGRPVESPYSAPLRGNPWSRGRALVREPATWRDLAWLVLLFPAGLAGGLAGVLVGLVDLGTILAPVWLWAVPNPYLPPVVDWLFNTTGGRFVLTVIGLLLAPAVWWLVTTAARLQATAAAALLEPGPRQRLARRARELAVTRRRVVDAQAAELRRIERDLHDGAQARIVAAGMTLALAERKLRQTGQTAGADIGTARRQLDEALAELRRLVRGIHPPILTDRGLTAALAALAGDAPLPVEVRASELGDLPPAVESAAYFVAAEGLANAVKHAAAAACTITIERGGDTLSVAVHDDGRGGADATGSGLDGLRRRVEALDGTLSVTSPAGGPTTVRAELPCAL
ncbi:sensor histidine kinase [Amycolatopsis thermophila]|uniref:histidine kinase n=1 Tax=Amycolatopsis thermophila TaxID=206084 RepID=A0ABU0EUD7_9PSEU|nr:sensor histidine kinase [Amycolatopsis thermophila]MDQ0378920.1 signal transduction histidine kinase [Amycolatopsis thermophila]